MLILIMKHMVNNAMYIVQELYNTHDHTHL